MNAHAHDQLAKTSQAGRLPRAAKQPARSRGHAGVRRHGRRLAVLAPTVALGVTGLAAPVLMSAPAQAATVTAEAVTGTGYTNVATFNYVGNAEQHFTVPPLVTSLTFYVVGGGGAVGSASPGDPGGNGGNGGVVAGTMPVTPGQTLDLCVGGRGGDGVNGGAGGQSGGCGYFSGGSGGSTYTLPIIDSPEGPGAGGGAASVIADPAPSTVPALGLALPYTPLVVAGGGGGGSGPYTGQAEVYGGNGGNGGKPAVDGGRAEYIANGTVYYWYGTGGTGGGSSSPTGADGLTSSSDSTGGGGGGGGGLPGGAGGYDAGGGGGESWASPTVNFSKGSSDTTPENGRILLQWTDPYDLYVANSGSNAIGIYGPATEHHALAGLITGSATGLDEPEGVAFDSAGRLYVANARDNTITEYAPGATGDATPVATIAGLETHLDDPGHIAIGPDGRLYVVNTASNTVTEYAPGASGDVAPMATIAGSATEITKPLGIAVDSAGRVYVSNNGNNSVTGYIPNANGDVVPSIVIKGAKTGLDQPDGLSFDNSGALLVTNGTGTITRYYATVSGDQPPLTAIGGAATGLVQPQQAVFDPADGSLVADSSTSGKLLSWPDEATGDTAPGDSASTKPYTGPAQIAINRFLDSAPLYSASPSLYVASYGLNTITIYSSGPAGPQFAGAISGSGTGLDRPEGVAFDSAGRLYVANSAANTITEYAPGSGGDASPVATITGQKTGLSDPGFLALDGAGHLYVVNNGTNSVTEYDQGASGDTSPVETIAGPATGITHPEGIAVDPAGHIYLSNRDNNTVTTYAKGANGNVKPIGVLSGAKTGLDRPVGLSYQAGHLVVTNDSGGVATFATPAEGDQAPASVLAVTGTVPNAEQAVFDTADDTMLVDSLTQGTVVAWPAAATSDTAPLWSLLVNANASSQPTQMALNPLSPGS